MAMRRNSKESKSRRRDISELNVFKRSTHSTEEALVNGEKCKPVTLESAKSEIKHIVSKIFQGKNGSLDAVSSSCSSSRIQPKCSQSAFDRRLQYWKDHVEQRKKIAAYIEKKTGKKQEKVLFNRRSTVDEPDKQNVLRIIDYADRLNPDTLRETKQATLKAYVDASTCTEVPELSATLPLAERQKSKTVEITGMPRVTKKEQLGSEQMIDLKNPSQWFQSQFLEQRVHQKHEDIARVIEFFPYIEQLEIVGEAYHKLTLVKHNSEIDLLPEADIRTISSETNTETDWPLMPDSSVNNINSGFGVKINDKIFWATQRRSADNVKVEVTFVCEPYEVLVKRVIHVENIGKKTLNFVWSPRPYYDQNPTLLKGVHGQFVFDSRAFRLMAGEMRDIIVQYQPRRVERIRQLWLLNVDPQFFCKKHDPILVKFVGKCVPPEKYVIKLAEVKREVIQKSNFKMLLSLNSSLASMTPMIVPHEKLCPYQRALTDCELFEFENPGIKCERLQDLIELKEIYDRLKKPREPDWDLKLGTLKELILRQEGAADRSMVFSQLMYIVNNMRGQPVDLEDRLEFEENFERERTLLLFVRGILITGIDDWEAIAAKTEEGFARSIVEEYTGLALEQQKQYMAVEHPELEELNFPSNLAEEIAETVVPMVRRQKVLRDTLYMQTYQHLCNIAESIANVIEGIDGV